MLTRQVLENLLRLRTPEFSALRVWLGQELEGERNRLMNLQNADQFRCVQGRAQRLAELLQAIEDAPKLLEKVQQPGVARNGLSNPTQARQP